VKALTLVALAVIFLTGCDKPSLSENHKPDLQKSESSKVERSGAGQISVEGNESSVVRPSSNAVMEDPQSWRDLWEATTPTTIKCYSEKTALACDAAIASVNQGETTLHLMCQGGSAEACSARTSFEAQRKIIELFKRRYVEGIIDPIDERTLRSFQK
jgi:hypothetical protein